MKIINLKIVIPCVLLLTILSCQPEVDIEKEKEAIMAVIQAEGDAFMAKDTEKLYDLFVQDDLNVRLGIWGQSYNISKGWEEVKAVYEGYYENFMEGLEQKNIKENPIIRISKNTAWVICDNIWDWKYQGEEGRWGNLEVVFLEKVKNTWKVSFMSFLPIPGNKLDKDNLDKTRAEFLDGMNDNDIDKFMALISDDHVTMPPGDKILDNPEDYRAWQEKRIAGMKGFEFETDIQLLENEMYNNVAYDRFHMKFSLTSKVSGNKSEYNYQVIWIWKKIGGGQWRLSRAIWNEFMP
jgi:ketosteroid isomerase-like protein